MPEQAESLKLGSSNIPPLIHQVCLSATLPDVLRKNIDTIRTQNPGWSHCLYDDEMVAEFIAEQYGLDMLRKYLSIDQSYGAARADFFRYLVIYRRGGVYLDLKSTFLGSIDSVLMADDSYIISQWRNAAGELHEGNGLHSELAEIPGGEFQQWHVIAAPGHPFLERVIEQVVDGIDRYRARKETVGWKGVLNLTGPIAYTKAIAPILHHHPHRRIANEKIVDLQFSVLPAASHQHLFQKHYSRNTLPIIKRRWPLSTLDQINIFSDRVTGKIASLQKP
jgi:mannosyltransferase OCH1-like enzyme